MGRRVAAALSLACAGLAGCAEGALGADVPSERAQSAAEALVLVERTDFAAGTALLREDDPASEARSNVTAKVVRLAAGADRAFALEVVGASLEGPALGTCRPVSSATLEPDRGRAIELLPIGELSLEIDGASSARVPLATRAFPDVGELVSGVFYTSEDSGLELPSGARYRLRSADLSEPIVEERAPELPRNVRVAGEPLEVGAVLRVGEPIELSWDREGRGDRVIVELSSPSGVAVRCALGDEGWGRLPAGALDSFVPGDEVLLAVHRVRSVFARAGADAVIEPAEGVLVPFDGADVRFDFAIVGHATVAP
jgi:hypothetical protein